MVQGKAPTNSGSYHYHCPRLPFSSGWHDIPSALRNHRHEGRTLKTCRNNTSVVLLFKMSAVRVKIRCWLILQFWALLSPHPPAPTSHFPLCCSSLFSPLPQSPLCPNCLDVGNNFLLWFCTKKSTWLFKHRSGLMLFGKFSLVNSACAVSAWLSLSFDPRLRPGHRPGFLVSRVQGPSPAMSGSLTSLQQTAI